MSRTSPLGPEQGRIKLDVRMPPDLAEAVGEVAAALGIAKGTLVVLGTSLLCVQLAPLAALKNRRKMVAALTALFQKTVKAIADKPE